MAKNLPGLAAVAAIALVMCGGACAQAQASPGPDPVLGRDCRLQDPGGDPAELNRTFTFVSQVVVAGTLAPPRVPCGAMGSESVVDHFATERALAAAPAVTAIAARHPEIAGTCKQEQLPYNARSCAQVLYAKLSDRRRYSVPRTVAAAR